MSNNAFTDVGLFNWWPSGTGVELAQEVKEWLQTYEPEEKDDFEGLGSLFGAENNPKNALELSKWYERTGIRRNPDISEKDYSNRSRESKYHLWFHENVKVRFTRQDFLAIDAIDAGAIDNPTDKISYEITVYHSLNSPEFIFDNQPFKPLEYLMERLKLIKVKTFFTDNIGVKGSRGEVESWELYGGYELDLDLDLDDDENRDEIYTSYPLWFIPESFAGLGSLFGAEQEGES
tara:strand:- start:1636 stop:2337 length:702 start_codon:yes stop_codon:yes gene_type:complete